jgi:hypothetical protein
VDPSVAFTAKAAPSTDLIEFPIKNSLIEPRQSENRGCLCQQRHDRRRRDALGSNYIRESNSHGLLAIVRYWTRVFTYDKLISELEKTLKERFARFIPLAR